MWWSLLGSHKLLELNKRDHAEAVQSTTSRYSIAPNPSIKLQIPCFTPSQPFLQTQIPRAGKAKTHTTFLSCLQTLLGRLERNNAVSKCLKGSAWATHIVAGGTLTVSCISTTPSNISCTNEKNTTAQPKNRRFRHWYSMRYTSEQVELQHSGDHCFVTEAPLASTCYWVAARQCCECLLNFKPH